MSPADLKPGMHVRHPSRGVGVVSTVVVSPLTGKAVKAWVEFPYREWRQKFVCFADDLTAIPPATVPTALPPLRVVAPHVPEIVA